MIYRQRSDGQRVYGRHRILGHRQIPGKTLLARDLLVSWMMNWALLTRAFALNSPLPTFPFSLRASRRPNARFQSRWLRESPRCSTLFHCTPDPPWERSLTISRRCDQTCDSHCNSRKYDLTVQTKTGSLLAIGNQATVSAHIDGVDVHQNNPGEEMNFHGTLVRNTDTSQGSLHGYPECFAAWDPSALPNNGDLVIGDQFALSKTSMR